jgi:hypothetical protein
MRSLLLGMLLLLLPPMAMAHDWYPIECCHSMDCAPVDHAEPNGSGGLTVTSRHGTGIVPDDMRRRESQDQRMHVCMQPNSRGGMRVICLFVPPLI